MKSFKYIFISLAAVFALCSCEKKLTPEEGKVLSTNFLPEKTEFPKEGGRRELLSVRKVKTWFFNNIKISADNQEYILYDVNGNVTDNIIRAKTIQSEWFTIEKNNIDLITVVIKENSSGKVRSVSIDIDQGNNWQRIEFSQKN